MPNKAAAVKIAREAFRKRGRGRPPAPFVDKLAKAVNKMVASASKRFAKKKG